MGNEYKAIFDEILDSPLVGRWDVTKNGETIIDPGLIDRFAEKIIPFISEEPEEIDSNFRRSRVWHYPTAAVREVFVNALAHRDWTRFVEIEVGVYSDRLEIVSPGALPNSMTVEKMIAGQRSPRNPMIMEILRDYGYVDYRGMGIRTKVVPLMMEHNGLAPIFDATEDYMKTTFFRKK